MDGVPIGGSPDDDDGAEVDIGGDLRLAGRQMCRRLGMRAM